ncbi:YjgF-like protein [Glarea lozoyensis ATCC 20868]|uniref:YjgF-like protein n=1 Tax=Glarea lozoyensis (strain ATCC 20868 / MF5171) TaxID=1116229 RepID=S3CKV4_GLAL2|nr:YjgF-like protein [Glarea lozoyensis ATCC 20868]EPE27157.1 YjgF-like protein [Glarea lozoyensis ATCC 20868]
MVTVLTENAMKPVGPYSQAITTPHAIYCSGQLPADAQGNLIEGTVAEKTRACINALSAVLDSAGSGLNRIVKVQIFLTDMADFPEMNEEYEKLISHKPARSCVAVKELPKGVNIEIECIALPGKRDGCRRPKPDTFVSAPENGPEI